MLTVRIKGITDTGCLKFQILLLNRAVTNKHSWCLLPFFCILWTTGQLEATTVFIIHVVTFLLLRHPSCLFISSFPTSFEFFFLLLLLRVWVFKPCTELFLRALFQARPNTCMIITNHPNSLSLCLEHHVTRKRRHSVTLSSLLNSIEVSVGHQQFFFGGGQGELLNLGFHKYVDTSLLVSQCSPL